MRIHYHILLCFDGALEMLKRVYRARKLRADRHVRFLCDSSRLEGDFNLRSIYHAERRAVVR